MSVATSTAIAIGAGVSAAGGLASAAIGSSAAGHAADTQANAAVQAAQIQAAQADKALAFNKQQFGISQQELAPWLIGGQGAEVNLAYLLGIAPPSAFTGNAGIPASVAGLAGNAPLSSLAPNSGAGNPNAGNFNDVTGAGRFPGPGGQRGGPGPLVPMQHPAQGATNAQGVPLSSLVNPNLGAFGSLSQPWTQQFQAPTNVTEQNDPGFQFRLQEGQQALERSAAARGSILTGGTAKALDRYAQDYASNEYGNVYNRAFNQYAQSYNQFQQGQSNLYNRLAGVAGLGQQTAQQLGYLGNQSAGNVSNILLTSGQQQGNALQNAAYQHGSGYINSANAINSGISGIGNALSQYALLSQLNGQSSGVTNPGAGTGFV